jgi:oligoendopeptidase F
LQTEAPQEEHLRWDLAKEFYPGPQSVELEADIARLRQMAREFNERYLGQIEQPGLRVELLVGALAQLEQIAILGYKINVYANLLFSLDTRNEVSSALLARSEELDVEVERQTIFFGLEWRRVPEETTSLLLSESLLARWRHYLEKERALAPHTLSDAEEAILNELSPISLAWESHFSRIMGRVQIRGKALATAISALFDPQRENRKSAQQATTRVLKREAPYLIDILNALLKDRQIRTKLHRYEGALEERNLDNEISNGAVEALLSICDANAGLSARYYALKRRMLGLPHLYDWDRYAPLFQTEKEYISLAEARRIIVEAYGTFYPPFGEIIDRFFTESWIDTPTAVGKEDGAFAASCPFLHPFILMSWEGTKQDVAVLAHELGHGLHDVLCQNVSILQNHPPITVAETASVFGEQLVFESLLARAAGPRERLALLCEKIDDTLATVFRQTAFTRFEQKLHTARADHELSIKEVNRLWLEALQPMFGQELELTKDYGWWWDYVPHFFRHSFYCYGYAFGQLLVLALYARYKKGGESFIPKHLAVLSAGGSEYPVKLLAPMEINLEDPNFWQEGMGIIKNMIEEAERLAAEI